MFQTLSRRRAREIRSFAPELLELRVLPTVDLVFDILAPGITQNAVRDPSSGDVSTDATFFVKIDNAGNSTADLTNGTPDNDADNVFIHFFVSSDAILDGGDTFVGEFNMGLFNTSLNANGSTQFNIGDPMSIPISSNSNFIIGVVDATDVLAETNEINNVKFFDIRTPTLGITGAGNFTDKKKAKSIDPLLGFLDGDSANYNGGRIVASYVDAQTKEFLQVFRSGKGADKVKLSGTTLKVGNRVVGTVSGNKTSDLTIDFNGNLDQFDVQNILRSIGFRVRSDSPAERNFTFQLSDPDNHDSPVADKEVAILFS